MMIPMDEQLKMLAWLDETKVLGKDSILELNVKVQDYEQRTGTVIEIIEPTENYGTVTVKFSDGTETQYSYDNVFDVLRVLK